MNAETLYNKALALDNLSFDEALHLYREAPLQELLSIANTLRYKHVPGNEVTWQIDRNVNITNVCVSGCRFCNFHCGLHSDRAYITSPDEYSEKIEAMLALGGDQLLLQGGLHPKLGIDFYTDLFRELKKRHPQVKLHALGPPEIAHIAKVSSLDAETVLRKLIDAGLDSLPGAGAEILDNDIRKRISPGKCPADRWLEVMEAAHRLGLATSATMMYGHVEGPEHRIAHLIKLRDTQKKVPPGHCGFLAFIAWPYCGKGTVLEKEGVEENNSPLGYLRLIAISRIVLNNIRNIQASWLTVGRETAQAALHGGANDMGSIMIEENVVSSAGASNSFDAAGIQQAIREAGFTPRLRDQKYNFRD